MLDYVRGISFFIILFVFVSCGRHQENTISENKKTGDTISTKAAQNIFLTLHFVGDIMMGSNYPNKERIPPKDGTALFDGARDSLLNADITCGNLEAPLLTAGGKPKECKDSVHCYIFRTPEHYVANLKNAGFDFLNTANNHCVDMGGKGIESTIRTLEEAGILFAGYLQTPVCTSLVNGIKVGFAGFAPHKGCSDFKDTKRVIQIVAELKKQCAIVIVSFHSGAEGTDCLHVPRKDEMFLEYNRGDVYKFAHTVIDAGADLVFGHGPHVPRGMELYRDRIIAYSLGNFCTYRFAVSAELGIAPLLRIQIDSTGTFITGRIIPFRQFRSGYPVYDQERTAVKLIKKLSLEDFPESDLTIDDDGNLEPSK